MLSWRASVDDAALAHFGLKPHKLLIRASARRSIDNSDLIRLQRRMIKFEQIGPAAAPETLQVASIHWRTEINWQSSGDESCKIGLGMIHA